MNHIPKALLAAVGMLLAIGLLDAQTTPKPGDAIRVTVTGFRSDNGQLHCALYASADGFPKKPEKAVAHTETAIAQKQATCEFAGVAPGTYAISVFHDENSNGKLDTNFIGMPKEGVGASNNAQGHMGPPKFDAAKFSYAGGPLELKITLRYL